MNAEQCEAKCLELAESRRIFGNDYYLTREQLATLIGLAHAAGCAYQSGQALKRVEEIFPPAVA